MKLSNTFKHSTKETCLAEIKHVTAGQLGYCIGLHASAKIRTQVLLIGVAAFKPSIWGAKDTIHNFMNTLLTETYDV